MRPVAERPFQTEDRFSHCSSFGRPPDGAAQTCSQNCKGMRFTGTIVAQMADDTLDSTSTRIRVRKNHEATQSRRATRGSLPPVGRRSLQDNGSRHRAAFNADVYPPGIARHAGVSGGPQSARGTAAPRWMNDEATHGRGVQQRVTAVTAPT